MLYAYISLSIMAFKSIIFQLSTFSSQLSSIFLDNQNSYRSDKKYFQKTCHLHFVFTEAHPTDFMHCSFLFWGTQLKHSQCMEEYKQLSFLNVPVNSNNVRAD